jgi:CP family cyanate transporter-like MFS transporter
MMPPPWFLFVLLWLIGADTRVTMLAIPPVLPQIHADLGLNETSVAALTSLPVLVLAAASILGSFLITSVSARRAAVAGLVVAAATSALRGAGHSTPVLFAMTFGMAVGIAIIQPALPALVGQWFPGRIGLATAVYANGLLVGETASASLTLPVVLPLVGGRWEWSLAVWSVPVFATALLLQGAKTPSAAGPTPARRYWRPDWGRSLTWRLGLLQAGSSAAYFGANAFIPEFLQATGRPHLIGAALTALNAGQLPASAVMLVAASRMVGKREPLLVAGGVILASLGAFLLLPAWATVPSAALLGFCAASLLILGLALPPLLVSPDDVPRLAAGMFAIGYSVPFALSLLGGVAWDVTGVPATGFLPVAAGGLIALGVSGSLARRG